VLVISTEEVATERIESKVPATMATHRSTKLRILAKDFNAVYPHRLHRENHLVRTLELKAEKAICNRAIHRLLHRDKKKCQIAVDPLRFIGIYRAVPVDLQVSKTCSLS